MDAVGGRVLPAPLTLPALVAAAVNARTEDLIREGIVSSLEVAMLCQ